MSDFFASRTLVYPLSFESWIYPNAMPDWATRWWDIGTSTSNSVYYYHCPCYYDCGCPGRDGYALKHNTMQNSAFEQSFSAATGTSYIPLRRWTHLVVTYSAPSGGRSTARAYKNGLLVATGSAVALNSMQGSIAYIGRSVFPNDPFVVDSTIGAFRVYSSELSASQVRLAYASASAPLAGPAPLIVEYMFSDCPINRNVLTTTGELPAAKLVGDADVTAPCSDAKPKPGPISFPAPLVLSAISTGPMMVLLTANFTAGVGIDTLNAACGAPGAPTGGYVGSASVTDADAAGADVSVSLELRGESRAGYETLLLTVYDGTQLKQRVPLFLAEHSIPADGSWHHVALVLVVDAYYAFLDGVPRPSARASSFTPGTGTVPKRTRTTHYVGAGWPAGSGPYAYGVELADFRVYSAALSAAQVADVAQGNAVDYSGKGRPGTMYGDLGPSVQCPVPAAGAYFGTSEIGGSPSSKHRYIEAPKFALGTPFSLDLWVRIPRQAPISNWQSIIDFGCGAGCHNIAIGWCVPGGFTGISQCHSKAGATGLAIVIHLYPEPTNPPYYETVFFRDDYSIPKDNQWHHLTFVFTNAEFRTYRNGSLLPHMKTGQAGAAGASIANMERALQYIGRSHWGAQSPSDVYYSGFRIHSAALTAEQVMEAFMGRQPAAPVVLHYKLDSCGSTLEGTLPGKDVPDSSGRGLSGKFVGDIAMACPPPAAGLGLRFGTAGGAAAQRYLDMSDFFASRTLVYPLSIESWIYPNDMPAFASRWVEYGTGLSNTVWFFNCPCSNAGCGCQGKDGYLLLQNSQQSSVYEEGLRAAMGTSFVPLQRWTHLVVTYSAPSGGQSTAKAYKNGLLVSTRSVRELQSIPRPMVYIGRSLNQGDPYVVDATIGAFRVYSSELSASQVRLAYASASTPLAGPAPLIAEYIFSDCPINRTVLTTSGELPAATIVGDANLISCLSVLPAPLVLSAISTGPMTVLLTANFTAGVGIATLDAACDAPGAPTGGYAGSASVTDADAAGAAVSVSVELSYGGSYVVSCSVKARGHSGGVSPPSAAVNATVPPGNSIAAQNALLPSGNTGASNAFSRVGNAVDPQESVRIVFAAPLANYLVGQRPASHRLGFITRTTSEFSYCDFDLDSNRCSFVQRLADMLGDAEPTDFAYSSMTPSNWPWTSQAYKNASDLVGSTVAAVLRPPSDCAGFGCYSHAAQRWAAYAFGGCAPAPYGPIRSWPAGLCSGARPYDFMSAAAAWTHDFRHFYAAYERTFYEAVSGLASASPTEEYNWAGMLGNMNLFSISPTGSNANITEHRSRHFRLQPELFGFAWATPGAETSSSVAFGSHFFYGATNCLDFYDAEPSGRTFEGNETASDIRRAYPDLTPFDALLLQELRLFQFWQRGVAFFSSFAALRNSGGPSVVPLLKVCSLPLGVALLKFDLAAIAPAGFTTSAESVYKSVPWPEENSAFFADSFPVGPLCRLCTPTGALPTEDRFCTTPSFGFRSSPTHRARAVAHVIAMFTWEVDPSRFVNAPVGVRSFNPSFPAPSTYRTAVFTHTAPRVLRSEQLALADHWIVQNERPLHAGYGHGYLEGRWVDPPNSKYSFWVTGDRVTRVRKANAFQSGMAGPAANIDGSIRIYKTADWRGTRQEWTSVATAVYKDGNLYVVQEVHTQANTRVFTFASDRETRPQYVHSRRMKRATERAPGSRLIRLENVDASGPFSNATVKVNTIVSNFPANVLYATVVDDYSSGRMFENDPSIPFSELPWVVFVVSEPAYVIKLHSRCKPGTRWNWEAALFNRSVAIADLCVDLPAGRYSPREGLLLDEDAELCPSGTFSGAGATECTTCSAGTSSDLGASACYGACACVATGTAARSLARFRRREAAALCTFVVAGDQLLNCASEKRAQSPWKEKIKKPTTRIGGLDVVAVTRRPGTKGDEALPETHQTAQEMKERAHADPGRAPERTATFLSARAAER
eukprot:tig00020892_g14907.t1